MIRALVLVAWLLPAVAAVEPPTAARPAVLVRVIDGDTWVLDVDLGYDVHVHATIREEGLFAPELRTAEGVVAKARAERVFTECARRLRVESAGHRSFERWVGRTWACGMRIAERLRATP